MGRRAAGLTLVEVLVALMIIALALTAALHMGSNTTTTLHHTQKKILAHWVGMNAVARLQLGLEGSVLQPGEWHGVAMQGQQDWYWKAVAKPMTDLPQFLQVDMVVAEKQETTALDTLTVFLRVKK